MISRVKTLAFSGLDPIEVSVEAQILPGIHSFCIVGLPDKAVAEAKERIRAALYYLGLSLPAKRITVNMAPADIPKVGSHFDLPITLALLGAMEVLDIDCFENFIALGELGLDGTLHYVAGIICAAMYSVEKDLQLICPKVCEKEALWSGHNAITAAQNLSQLLNHFRGVSQIARPDIDYRPNIERVFEKDLSDIHGQYFAKRALEIAASGRHNILLIGPPGSGKSMLAERIETILPPLTPKEALETTCVYSIAGMLSDEGLIFFPPFRNPHHSASLVSIVGGGSSAKPGEISLAHNGVLFLDEFSEFPRAVIESLRQPLENRNIMISRVKDHVVYPADILLVAAMNPCRCGYFGITSKECSKAPQCAEEYQRKISGPILDRFDLIVRVKNIENSELFQTATDDGMDSTSVRKRVSRTRKIQRERANSLGLEDRQLNGQIAGQYLDVIAKLGKETEELLAKAFEREKLSVRSVHKVLRVARTIADMRCGKNIESGDVAEALMYHTI